MPNTEREVLLAPASRDGVQITCADTTSLDLNIDVVVAKRFRIEFGPFEFGPVFWILDLEARECLGVDHYYGLRTTRLILSLNSRDC
jgi:hypothetical protein